MISLVKCSVIKLLLLISVVNANWNNSPVCVPIPANFTLCRDIAGWNRMKIPNLLNHESLAEAFQQANGWLPLLQLGCSPHTKLFLCSLFTPVCVEKAPDQSIPPCRSLCESVKSSCLPQMIIHGFDWPRIVDCNQYPLDNGMCINAQQQQPRKKPQDTQIKTEQILQQFCQSDWVLKVKGTLIVNNLNETATLHVHNFTVLKGEFANEQQKILPVFVNDLRFWNQLLTTGSSAPEKQGRFKRRSIDRPTDRLESRFKENRFSERTSERYVDRPADGRQSTVSGRSKHIQTFKNYTFIMFGRTTQQLNGQAGQKLTLFFPLTNKLPYLKKLYYKRIRANRVNCEEQLTDLGPRTKSDLESILYFERENSGGSGHRNQPTTNLMHQPYSSGTEN